jgi:hypothetical protein
MTPRATAMGALERDQRQYTRTHDLSWRIFEKDNTKTQRTIAIAFGGLELTRSSEEE